MVLPPLTPALSQLLIQRGALSGLSLLAKKTFFRGKVWREPTFGALGPSRLQPWPEVAEQASADLRVSPLEGILRGFAAAARPSSPKWP